ncbi:MAG: HAD family phosphatase [Actinobacteria bacterium]|nr:HAD family phosphatase [Actinomycetota bacterium]
MTGDGRGSSLPPWQLLATDLDGTLLRRDGSVGAAVREALLKRQKDDRPTLFVTGRPPRWLPSVAEATGIGPTTICANGAVVLDLSRRTITEVTAIPDDMVATVAEIVRDELGVDTALAWELARPGPLTASGFRMEHGFAPESAQRPVGRPEPGEVVKILARGQGEYRGDHRVQNTDFHKEVQDTIGALTERLSGLATVSHSSRTHLLAEIGPPGVTKATTLARAVVALGLTAGDVLAVGDMPNDIPMLEWAGTAAVVDSAHPSVLAHADIVIPDPEHDGVARLLAGEFSPTASPGSG